MEREAAFSHAQRLSRISYLLYRNPGGLTVAELADLCGVSPRTVQRDLQDLEEMDIPIWEEPEGRTCRYGITEGYYLPPVHLQFEDALALYLAARLLARYADDYDPQIVHALAKLAAVLPEPVAAKVQATAATLTARQPDETFRQVLRTLAKAWATGRQVRIHYRAAESEHVHRYELCPYLIEPLGVGNATYVIGHASYFDAVRTFKVERIRHAELLDARYEIPDGFAGPAMLESGWGIMYGEAQVEVALRFVPEAVRRVRETRWHPSQCLEETPDGGCVLRVTVAHPEEMRYWILGWGAQVEVLAPAWLRDEIAGYAPGHGKSVWRQGGISDVSEETQRSEPRRSGIVGDGTEGTWVRWDGVSPGGVMIGGCFYLPPGCTPEEEAAIWEAEMRKWDGVDDWLGRGEGTRNPPRRWGR